MRERILKKEERKRNFHFKFHCPVLPQLQEIIQLGFIAGFLLLDALGKSTNKNKKTTKLRTFRD